MAQMLVRHGTYAGYREELHTDNVCERCRNAAREYEKQRSRAYKAKGIKYGRNDVIDHLYKPVTGTLRSRTARPSPEPVQPTVTRPDADPAQHDPGAAPGLRERLSDALFSLKTERKGENGYVPIDETPEYIHPINPDPEPSGDDWSKVTNDEFVVTAHDFNQIKDNLGTYLTTVGMTLGLIDPYCGGVLRDNLDDMVNSWAKVITHYPSAAKIFMAKGGGKIMAWIDALMATWPILLAIYEHHLAHTVTINSLGQAVKVSKADANPNGHFATQPDFNYTVE